MTCSTSRRYGLVTILAAGVFLGGCGGSENRGASATLDTSPPTSSAAPSSAAPSSDTASPTSHGVTPAAPEDDGISYDEAAERDVLHGEYDALATPIGVQPGGVYEFQLRNMGRADDSYTVSVAVSKGAEAWVEPAQLQLAPGEAAPVVVVVSAGDASDVELVVTSAGLAHQEVVRIPAT